VHTIASVLCYQVVLIVDVIIVHTDVLLFMTSENFKTDLTLTYLKC
jgi:hypothetical protein